MDPTVVFIETRLLFAFGCHSSIVTDAAELPAEESFQLRALPAGRVESHGIDLVDYAQFG